MLSSTDVAGLFQSQNSMFMGQNSYAQQIGVSRGGGGAPSYSPASAFGAGNAGGSRAAGFGMSAVGAAAQIGAGMAFDPFGAFIGGAAGAMGRGGLGAMMGGGMAAALPMIPLAIGAQMTIGAGIRGGQQQNQISQQLGGYNFMNSGARSGQGFSRQDAQGIGDSIRQLSHIPEMMSSVEELTKLMPKLKASGVMSGVKSAGEFQQRFKEAVSTIRDMSKVLGTTMEEAEQFFAHSRSVGFTGRSGQLKNTMNAQLTSGMTGMSTGQVMQLQSAGAGMATQVGARRSQGATAVTNMAQTLGKAQQEGRLAQGALEDMTGLQGGDAIQAGAQRMTEAMYNFSQNSSVGKLMMVGLTKFDKSGKAIGLDDDRVRQLQSGAIGIEDLKKFGSGLTNSQKISFMHRKSGSLAMDLAGKVGAGGVSDIFSNLLGGKGTDADRMMFSRHTGLNEQESDVAFSLGGMGMGDEQGVGQMSKLRAREASFKERTDPGMILKRMKTKLHASMLGGIEQAGSQIFTDLGKQYDSFVDEVVGRHIVTLSKEGTASLQKAMSGGSKKELNEMFAAASGLKAGSAASRKFGFGDALTLGSQGVGSIFTDAGQSAIGKLTSGSEIMAGFRRLSTSTSSGRDAQGKFESGERLIGGMKEAKALDAGSGLDAEGKAAMLAARGDVRSIAAGIKGFDEMDADEKYRRLSNAIDSKMQSDMIQTHQGIGMGEVGSRLHKAMAAGRKAGAKTGMAGLIGGTKGLNESMTGVLGSSDSVGQFYGVKEAAKLNKLGDEAMEKAGLKTTLSLVKSNPNAKKALSLAQSGSEEGEKVRDLIKSGDHKGLVEMGIQVGPNDVDALKESLREMEEKGNTEEGKAAMKGAFDIYDAARQNSDVTVIQGAFRDTAKSINDGMKGLAEGEGSKALQSVATAMDVVAKGGSGTGWGKDIDDIRSSMTAYSKALSDPKLSGSEKDKLIKAGGDLGSVVSSAQRATKKLKGNESQDEVLRAYGLDDSAKSREMLAGHGVGAGSGMNAGVDRKALENAVAGYKGAAVVAAGKSEMAGETSLPKVLGRLEKAIDVQNTIMVAVGNKMGADMSGTKIVEKSQNGTNETGKAANQ